MSLVPAPAPAPAPVEEDVLLTPLYDALVGEYASDTPDTGADLDTGAGASDIDAPDAGIPVEGVSAEVLGLDTGAVLYEGPLSEEHEAWLMSRMSALRVDPRNPLHGGAGPRNPLHGGTTGKEDLA